MRDARPAPRGTATILLARALFAAAVLAVGRPASGHLKSLSYSSFRLDPKGARVEARMSALDATAIAEGSPDTASSDRIGSYLARRLQLLSGGASCTVVGTPTRAPAAEGWVARAWSVECPVDGPREIRSSVLLPENPAHLHFARATLSDGRVVERILGETEPSWRLEAGDAPAGAARHRAPSSFAGWVSIGADHLLSGRDHLAFLAALLLLARRMSAVAKTLLAYAIASSIGLAAGAIGLLSPASSTVGTLVGFSIAQAAVEDSYRLAGGSRPVAWTATLVVAATALLALRRPDGPGPVALAGLAVFSASRFGLLERSHRPERDAALLAAAFGLVHGLGFATGVAGLDLAPERLAPALLGFNLGVEVALVAAAAIAWPIFRLATRLAGEAAGRAIESAAAGSIAGLGAYWFLTRALA